MKFLHWNTLDLLFKVVCTLATVFMIVFWLIKFLENEDVSVIEKKDIEDFEELIYPEISLCILNPFLDNKLKAIHSNLSTHKYKKYLFGKWNTSFDGMYKKIDFNNVTLDIFDYLTSYSVQMRNTNTWNTYHIKNICQGRKNCPFVKLKNNFNGHWLGEFYRCFGVEIKPQFSKNIRTLFLTFHASLASPIYQIQRAINRQSAVSVSFNYPQQFLKAGDAWEYIWDNPNNATGHYALTISSLEVTKRRNKRNSPCSHDGMPFDECVHKKHLDKVGCSAPYHYSDKPLCITKEKLAESVYELTKVKGKYCPPPCQEMSDIAYISTDVKELTANQWNFATSRRIILYYPNKIKLITQSQSIDIQALIGNIGGYIGLFLGKILP